MFMYTFFFFMSVVSISHFMRHALNAEGVMNGVSVDQSDFQFQVGIFEIHSETDKTLIGSGVIVGSSWILTVAHFFMKNYRCTRDVLFTAVVGSSGFGALNGVSDDIIYIYTYDFQPFHRKNDIAMAKTKNDFLTLRITFREMEVPDRYQDLMLIDGTVSGYGDFGTENIVEDGVNQVRYITSDHKLRKTSVQLNPSWTCKNDFHLASTFSKVCGITSKSRQQYTGMCWNDAGNPVVIDGKVVALSSFNHGNCDDTQKGSLYTVTWKYYQFVQDAKNDILGNSMSKHLTLNSRLHSIVQYNE